jgi:hypothetical protein
MILQRGIGVSSCREDSGSSEIRQAVSSGNDLDASCEKDRGESEEQH